MNFIIEQNIYAKKDNTAANKQFAVETEIV